MNLFSAAPAVRVKFTLTHEGRAIRGKAQLPPGGVADYSFATFSAMLAELPAKAVQIRADLDIDGAANVVSASQSANVPGETVAEALELSRPLNSGNRLDALLSSNGHNT